MTNNRGFISPVGNNQQGALNRFEREHPGLIADLKSHRLSKDQISELQDIARTSREMTMAVCMYLAKYAAEGSKLRAEGVRIIDRTIDQLYGNDHPQAEEIVDGILDFMVDNRKVFQHFSDMARSWENVQFYIRVARGDFGAHRPGQDGIHPI